MRTHTTRALIAVVTCLVAFGLTGCDEVRLRTLGDSARDNTSLRFDDLSSQQQGELEQVLEGEIQTVYASDTGLARAYGQVANFSDVSYEAVRFDVVAVMKAAPRAEDSALLESSAVTRVIGTFIVPNFTAGAVETFDVQTTVPTGEAGSMTIRVSGVR